VKDAGFVQQTKIRNTPRSRNSQSNFNNGSSPVGSVSRASIAPKKIITRDPQGMENPTEFWNVTPYWRIDDTRNTIPLATRTLPERWVLFAIARIKAVQNNTVATSGSSSNNIDLPVIVPESMKYRFSRIGITLFPIAFD
jgi:hypothetical protein